MHRLIPACALAVACAFAASVSAQDATVKTQTKVDADNAHVMTMTGCLQQGASGDLFVLSGATVVKGDDTTSKSRTKIDQDEDETEVTTRTKTEAEKDDEPVGTSGMVKTYELMPKAGVDLTPHVGHKVEVTAVALDAKKGGDDDAEVDIRTKTKVNVDDAPDAKVKSETKAELPRGATPRLSVVSVKHVAPTCTM